MGRPTVTAVTFWNRVKVRGENECWIWFGPTSKARGNVDSYGRIDAFGLKGIYVHRIAYYLANSGGWGFSENYPISLRKDGDVIIRHSCDNTLCCNPKHLIKGTHADNMHDKVERGRSKIWKHSTRTPRAKLTADDVRAIRELSKAGVTRKALASRYEVSVQTIKAVRSGRHYSDIL